MRDPIGISRRTRRLFAEARELARTAADLRRDGGTAATAARWQAPADRGAQAPDAPQRISLPRPAG
jgi:hypothetical protein